PVLVDYVRTPVGKKRGTLVRHRGDDLMIHCYETLLNRNDFDKNLIGDSIVACNSQIGECALDIGRNVALAAHLPYEVPGMSVNRHCASGSQAVLSAWQAIASGIHDAVICGGIEIQNKFPIGADAYIYDEELKKPMMIAPNKKILSNPGVAAKLKEYNTTIAGQINSAHVLGVHYYSKHKGISMKEFKGDYRDDLKHDLDEISLLSHEKACSTWDERGKEIEPIWCPKLDENGKPMLDDKNNVSKDESLSILTSRDETPRPGTSMEKLAKLRTIIGRKSKAFLTAGNSCPTSDGAAAQIWMTRELANELGLRIRATLVNFSIIGSDPVLMLDGPIKAIPEALNRADMTLDDMAFIEINEAFSPVVWACCKELNIDWKDPRFNPWGGAIALGHPTGATGARLIATNVSQLEQSGKEYAISSMCVGFGMSIATIVRNEHPK
ncbi:MAG: acetyl-CoA C-acyltransferase, partial [Candidatus Lokiarchaeota archaeon]|nr:acetyl-CoA C-acyltransferase [Candidatus Lokiarchaeota archaeon]MBD3339510.1 acetyl-CoA C-acyltransferase [Candidatus Lokiarchaeota archaeon]